MKISVVMPIYNAAEYLEAAIESICKQTYKNLEIICVNDGSTDGSGEMLERYAERDSRIVAIHKENGGESSARNVGLMVCTGDFIGFMDCDDWIEPDMYQTLAEAAKEYAVDMVASRWYFEQEGVSKEIKNMLPVKEGVFGRYQLLQYIYMRDSYKGFAYMWNKLYKRNLIFGKSGKPVLFDENLKLGGDVLYLSEMVLNTSKAVFVDKAFYHYRQRENSGCHTENLIKREQWLSAYCRIIERFENEFIEADIIDYVKRFLVYHSSNVAELAYGQKNREVLAHCQDLMKKYELEYINLNLQFPERIERYNKILVMK